MGLTNWKGQTLPQWFWRNYLLLIVLAPWIHILLSGQMTRYDLGVRLLMALPLAVFWMLAETLVEVSKRWWRLRIRDYREGADYVRWRKQREEQMTGGRSRSDM